MVKSDLITRIAKDNQITKKDSEIAIDYVVNAIKSIIVSGEDLYINEFGKFSIIDRKARMGHNPRTNEPAEIKAEKKIKFITSKNLKEELNK